MDAVLASIRRNPEFVALFGPSGSGKSSLMQAGVLPALARAKLAGSDRWGWLIARPGTNPWSQLAEAGLPAAEHGIGTAVQRWLTANPEHDRLVLVFDQFEELLTAATSQHRAQLLAQLSDLDRQELAVTVAIVMRDDFYSTLAAAAPGLMPAVTRGLVNVPAVLEPGELIAIIEKPAAQAGLVLEPHLSERIAEDATLITSLPGLERSGAPVTVLPLLSSALAELWSRRTGNRLTHEAYKQIDGVIGWLDRWCDRGYAEARNALRPDRHSLARLVITSLVRPGDQLAHIPPTRQRRLLSQLPRTGSGQGAAIDPGTEAVVAALANHRLLITSKDPAGDAAVVELAHEALIHEWRQLRRWLSDDHEFLAWRRDLEADYERWRPTGGSGTAAGDPQQLLKGASLVAARQWRDRRPGQLPAELTSFIDSSDRAEHLRLTHDRRRAVVFAIVAAVAVVMAVLTGGTAIVALRQTAKVQAERDLAEFNEITAQANTLRTSDPTLAAQLDLIAYRMRPDVNTYTDLINTETVALSTPLANDTGISSGASAEFSSGGEDLAVATSTSSIVHLWNLTSPAGPSLMPLSLTGHSKTAEVAFSSHRPMMVAFASDGTFWLWDLTNPGHPLRLGASVASGYKSGFGFQAQLSPDGRVLATANVSSFAGQDAGQLWDLADPGHPALVAQSLTGVSRTAAVAFRPDGHVLAAFGADGTLRLWNMASPSHPLLIGQPVFTGDSLEDDLSVEFSPDGRTLTVKNGGIVSLWDVANPDHPARVSRSLTGAPHTAAVAFSPSADILAAVNLDGTFQLWNVADPSRPAPLSQRVTTNSVTTVIGGSGGSIAFAPGGRILATTSPDHSIRLWNLSNPAHPIPLGQPLTGTTAPVISVAFSPDGHELASTSFDGGVRLWSVPQMLLVGDKSSISSVAFSPDGNTLAAVSNSAVRLWNVTRSGLPTEPAGPVPGAGSSWAVFSTSLAFSADGHLLAIATGDNDGVTIWQLTNRRPPAFLARIPAYNNGTFLESLDTVAFSPRGRILAIASNFGTIQLWNLANPRHPARCSQPATGSEGNALEFSPDGRILAVGGPALLNVADPYHPVLIGKPLANESNFSLAFSSDGRTLAAAAGNKVQLWNLTNLRHPAPIGQPLTGHTDNVLAVAFSPNGHTLASSSQDGTIRLWNLTDPRHPAAIGQPLTDANIGKVYTIAFSPDGNMLAAGSDDQVVRMWNLNLNQAIQRICATTRNSIVHQQWREYLSQIEFTPPCG